MKLGVIKELLAGGDKIIDNLTTTEEERRAADLQEQKLDQELNLGQIQTNQQEAKHKSIFVAGWRPFIGWVCGFGLLYQFVLYGFILWIWSIGQGQGWIDPTIQAPPPLDASQLMPLIFGMLGLGGLRTYDKLKGKSTESITGKPRELRVLKKLNRIRSKG